MLGTERNDFPSLTIYDDARHIGRLLRRSSPFNVNPVRKARDQIAPFRIDRQVQRLQKNGNGLGSGLHYTAVLNDHGDDSLATHYGCWKLEARGRVTGSIDGGFTGPCVFTIDTRSDRHSGS